MDRRLLRQLEPVCQRYRRWKMWTSLAVLWTIVATTGGVALWGNFQWGWYSSWSPLLLAGVAVGMAIVLCVLARSSYRDFKWLAHQIEAEYPELDARLITAIDIRDGAAVEPTGQFAQYGFLQTQVLHEVLSHAYKNQWKQALSRRSLAATHLLHWSTMAGAIAVLVCLGYLVEPPSPSSQLLAKRKHIATGQTEVSVEPGNKEIERNTPLVVLARFKGRQPEEVTLICRDQEGDETEYSMTRSMDDPIYAFQLVSVSKEFDYFIKFGTAQSEEFRITVFENPTLVRADAKLKYPKFANEADKLVEDFRHLAAVEGTRVTVKCKLNKPVSKAELVDEDGKAHRLDVVADENQQYQLSWIVTETKRFVLNLQDEAGRTNSDPPKLVVRATPNRRPQVKLKSPRDVSVSPLEEYLVQASFWDDFGLSRFGVTLNFNGEMKDVVLGKDQPKTAKPAGKHLLDFESLQAKPDQLLTYHFWAEDIGPNGKPRRTDSDMFFAEVRPFEEIYRQGQQPPRGQQQQRRNQSGQRGQQRQGQGARLAQLQKQIITATWNLIRRYDDAKVDDKYKADSKVIADSQMEAIGQAAAANSRIQDLKAKEHLAEAVKQMKSAADHLTKATVQSDKDQLRPALRAEQAAYRSLLNLRNREHRVIRQQQRQRQSSQSGRPNGGQQNNRQQRMLQQLKLSNEQNRYETQRTAQQQQQNNASQQKNRQLLNRLKELTRRQEDLNKQIQDLKSALQAAKTEKEREELRRQLKRLRDDQKNIMRDTDQVANNMDQATDPQQAAEAQRRLDQTRQDQRRAAESLKKGKLSQAAAAGSRAAKDLKQLRDDIRRKSANQFADEMKDIRKKAREIEKRQNDIRDQIAGGDTNRKKKLRSKDGTGRQATVQKLRQQGEQVGDLLKQMKQIVEKSEEAEPLLSDRLYDTWRKATQDKLANNAELTRQLLERGFVEQATKSEKPLADGVKRLRKGVERAAQTVLGDETQALKRAKEEVDRLRKELQSEANRAQGRPDSKQPPGSKKGSKRSQGGQPSGKGKSQNTRNRQKGARSGQPSRDGKTKASKQGRGKQADGKQGRGKQADGKQGRVKQGRGKQSRGKQADGKQGRGKQGRGKQGRGKQADGKQGRGKQGRGKQGRGKQASARGGKKGGGKQRGGQPGSQRPGLRRGGRNQNNPNDLGGIAQLFNEGSRPRAPLQGGDYREWSNRLRDVEEMLDDPGLRREAIRIREKMKEMRGEVKRHSKVPNWDVVQKQILGPLNELQKLIRDEIARREPSKRLVPLDRDPVPKEYEDKVKKYFQRLGGGK